jgi:hypothetical protein
MGLSVYSEDSRLVALALVLNSDRRLVQLVLMAMRVVLAGPYATMEIDPLKITLCAFSKTSWNYLLLSFFSSFTIEICERLGEIDSDSN